MLHSAQQLWDTVLGQLQLQVARTSYETWLRDTAGLSLDGQVLTVGVPTPFAAEWLERRLYALLQRSVEDVAKQPLQVRFQVVPRGTQAHQDLRAHADGSPQEPEGKGSPEPGSYNDEKLPRRATRRLYSFENFVVGPSNQLAYAAACSVASNPTATYNPVVLFADVGLGKSHLLHAIAHAVESQGLEYRYVTGEQFTSGFVRAIRQKKMDEFRGSLENVDLLLMDDFQFLAGKEQTQETFFHLFNHLHNDGRQIVLTSDRPPRDIPSLGKRLQSRLQWGLVVDIQPPDLQTQAAIIRAKADQLGFAAPPEVLSFIAGMPTSNVRELEGHLNSVIAWCQLHQQPCTLTAAKKALERHNGQDIPQHRSDTTAAARMRRYRQRRQKPPVTPPVTAAPEPVLRSP